MPNAVKIIKKNPQKTIEVAPDHPLKKFCIVAPRGRSRSTFRVWYATKEEAVEAAKTFFPEAGGEMLLVLEVQAAVYHPDALERKLEDIAYNARQSVLSRREDRAARGWAQPEVV